MRKSNLPSMFTTCGNNCDRLVQISNEAAVIDRKLKRIRTMGIDQASSLIHRRAELLQERETIMHK